MKKKILCIGDSLALPGHFNKYEDTWFYKLKKEYPQYDFTSFFKRKLTTEVLISWGGGSGGIDNWPRGADFLEAYLPDIVIIQLGIVDCAPRLLTKRDRFILKILPSFLKNTFINAIKIFKRRNVANTLVTYDNFKSYLMNYIKRAEKLGTIIIFISISIPDSIIIEINEDIIINITKFNLYYAKLQSEFNFISIIPPLDPSNYKYKIYSEGYHPNNNGHKIIFEKLIKILKILNV